MPQLHTTDLNSAGQNLSESVKKRLIYRKAFDHEIYMGCPLDYKKHVIGATFVDWWTVLL